MQFTPPKASEGQYFAHKHSFPMDYTLQRAEVKNNALLANILFL